MPVDNRRRAYLLPPGFFPSLKNFPGPLFGVIADDMDDMTIFDIVFVAASHSGHSAIVLMGQRRVPPQALLFLVA